VKSDASDVVVFSSGMDLKPAPGVVLNGELLDIYEL